MKIEYSILLFNIMICDRCINYGDKMNNFFRKTLSVIFIFSIFFHILSDNNFNNIIYIDSKAEEMKVSFDKRACWISFLDLEEFLCDLDETSYRNKLCEMYDNIVSNNMNTVIFHVRPMGDAVYPSNIFPWSVYISSDRSVPGYDPLFIAIEEAHKRGLLFEAWINPYRLSKNNETTDSFKKTGFYEYYKDIIMEYENIDGEICLSLDPLYEDSKRLIWEGVAEIAENYDIDSIHFDDYFYVSGMGTGLSIEEKKELVNNMVANVYKTIKSIKPTCQFGISPAGNMENAKEDGADIEKWLSEEGYVDYIMPQLYWTDDFISSEGEEIALFSKRCEEWQNVNVLDKPIYAGLALYKAGEKYSGDLGWSIYNDNLKRQCNKAYNMGYDGYALFRYAWLEYNSSVYELDNLNTYVETLSIIDNENKYNGDNSFNNYSVSEKYSDELNEFDNTYDYDDFHDTDLISCNVFCCGFNNKSIFLSGRLSEIKMIYRGIGAINLSILNNNYTGGIEYRVHSIGGTWSGWVRDGEPVGDKTCSKLIDGIQIRLYGEISKHYDLFYKTGYFDGFFTKWVCNGEPAGEMGLKGAIRCINIKIIDK